MQALITVIIPVYKVEKYLARCVDSVLAQTYRNLEVLLVDDGSPDNCGRICDEYAQVDSRVRVIHKPNGGLSSARNAALDIMTGEYVMFVDSDDYIALDCVEYLVGLVERFSAQIAIGNYEETRSSSCEFGACGFGPRERIELLSGREAIERQFGKDTVQYVSSCAKLYAREVFASELGVRGAFALRFPEGLLHEDEGTTYKALYGCSKVAVSQRVVYAYFYNTQSITKNPIARKYRDLCAVLRGQVEFYRERGEAVLEARVRNRFCIQAAAHYLPKGYFGESRELVRGAKQMYRGVWKVRQIPLAERVKGWMCAYLCGVMALLMAHLKVGRK